MSKLLVVEDDKDICEVIIEEITCQLKDIEIDVSYNAEDAFEKIKVNDYKLVLTDIRLPVMDGTELISSVKKELPNPPVFYVMTGLTNYPKNEALDKGGSAFYSKLDDLSELVLDIKAFFDTQA